MVLSVRCVTRCGCVGVLVVALAGASSCTPAGAESTGPDPVPGDVAEDKIDPEVLARMSAGPQPVLVLGQTQLLLGPDALEEFATARVRDSRLELRAEVIGRLKEIAETEQDAIVQALGVEGAHRLWLVNAVAAELDAEAIRRASRSAAVRYVYPSDGVPPAHQDGATVDDPSGGDDPPFPSGAREASWNLEAIGADRAWRELGATGRGVVIASLDTGVRYTHPDLNGRMWTNPDEVPNNGRDDDGNGWIDDWFGYDFARGTPEVAPSGSEHGTYVAGILVGDGTGGTVLGVAPGARLMQLKAGGDASVVRAMEYALENGADVLNMSFSRPALGNRRGLWRLMADHATAAGLVLVSGAGNFRQTAAIPVQLRIPEGIPSVIAAGGVTRERAPAAFSSMGPVGWEDVLFYGDHPHPPGLVKPDVSGFTGPEYPLLDPGGGYHDPNQRRGNSFSGPHAAGVAALVLSVAPDIPAWEVKRILEESATDLHTPGMDNRTGHGLLNAFGAVTRALER